MNRKTKLIASIPFAIIPFAIITVVAATVAYAAATGDRLKVPVMIGQGTSALKALVFDFNLGASNPQIIAPASDNAIAFATNGSEKMRITSNGQVGIGAVPPVAASQTYPLTVEDSSGSNLLIYSTLGGAFNQAGIDFKTQTIANPFVYPTARLVASDDGANGGHLLFQTKPAGPDTVNPITRLEILDNGNVGIGTFNPGAALDLYSSVNSDIDLVIENQAGGFGSAAATSYRTATHRFDSGILGNSNGTCANCYYIWDGNASAFRLVMDTSGNVGIGTPTPSTKLDVNGSLMVRSGGGDVPFSLFTNNNFCAASSTAVTVNCTAGHVAISGGCNCNGQAITISYPSSDVSSSCSLGSLSGGAPSSWTCQCAAAVVNRYAYAVCAAY